MIRQSMMQSVTQTTCLLSECPPRSTRLSLKAQTPANLAATGHKVLCLHMNITSSDCCPIVWWWWNSLLVSCHEAFIQRMVLTRWKALLPWQACLTSLNSELTVMYLHPAQVKMSPPSRRSLHCEIYQGCRSTHVCLFINLCEECCAVVIELDSLEVRSFCGSKASKGYSPHRTEKGIQQACQPNDDLGRERGLLRIRTRKLADLLSCPM